MRTQLYFPTKKGSMKVARRMLRARRINWPRLQTRLREWIGQQVRLPHRSAAARRFYSNDSDCS